MQNGDETLPKNSTAAPASPTINFGTALTDTKWAASWEKPDFCICENKDADQLRGNREADQRLYFRYSDSTIPLLHKSEISTL